MNGTVIKTTVAVVGCGPIGMFASHLLERFNIDYLTLEKHSSPRAHPSAHWVSGNSKLLMNQIPGLAQAITQRQEPWKYFECYRFSQGLFGHQLGVSDHFHGNIEQKIRQSKQLSGAFPSHIPQNMLLQTMYEQINKQQNSQNIKFGQKIREIKEAKNENEQLPSYILYNDKNEAIVCAKYVILCDGINSQIRDQYFHLKTNKQLMDVINIHFMSKKLADLIVSSKRNGMLHFSYGKDLLGILVNHSIDQGIFVLQVPNFEPIIDLIKIYSARDMIQMALGLKQGDVKIDDIQIIHTGKWNLQASMANKMNHQGIILSGDSAHAYPPAGGFGMNSGFQDIHSAVHSIMALQRNPKLNRNVILNRYSDYRLKVNQKYLQKSLQNLSITKSLAKSLGYPSDIKDYFLSKLFFNSISSFIPDSFTPKLEQLRLKAMKSLYQRKVLPKQAFQLKLFFDQFDIQAQELSNLIQTILHHNRTCIQQHKQKLYTLWVRKDIKMEEIVSKFGNIEQQNIRWFTSQESQSFKKGQKIIFSDGTIVFD